MDQHLVPGTEQKKAALFIRVPMSLDDLWILVKFSPPPIECCEKYCETQIALHRLRRCSIVGTCWYRVSVYETSSISLNIIRRCQGFQSNRILDCWGVRKKINCAFLNLQFDLHWANSCGRQRALWSRCLFAFKWMRGTFSFRWTLLTIEGCFTFRCSY